MATHCESQRCSCLKAPIGEIPIGLKVQDSCAYVPKGLRGFSLESLMALEAMSLPKDSRGRP